MWQVEVLNLCDPERAWRPSRGRQSFTAEAGAYLLEEAQRELAGIYECRLVEYDCAPRLPIHAHVDQPVPPPTAASGSPTDAVPPSRCDDGEDPFALCEVSVFRARRDEWFYLEWWGAGIGWSVSRAGESIYACDSGGSLE